MNQPHGEKTVVFGRIATLDLLRLFAALAVVMFHYFYRGTTGDGFLNSSYPEAEPFARYGYLGVNQFFLISGFVIAWSTEGRQWDTFAIARFARLYPGYLTCMAISFMVMLVAAAPQLSVTPMQFAANIFLFSPTLGQPFIDGVYWSIVLEVIFYGWIALAMLLGIFHRWKLQIISIWLAVCVLNETFIQSWAARQLFLTEFGPLFVGGILVHHLYSKGKSPYGLFLLGVTFLISCRMMLITQSWAIEHYGTAIPTAALFTANLFMFGLLIAAIHWRDIVHPSPLILMMGGLTYPLYLLHQNIGYIAINELTPTVGKWPTVSLVILSMLVLSWGVWRFIETPSRRWIVSSLNAVAQRLSVITSKLVYIRRVYRSTE